MKYQDSWDYGLVEKGKRSCNERYEIVKDFCNNMNKPFTVCDIGSNMNYFGIRLIEDFGCSVISFEFNQFEKRNELVKDNKNIMFIKRKITLNDMVILNKTSHFDLVLAMSVLHHLPGDSGEWINHFRQLGENVIMEFAINDSNRVKSKKNYSIPTDAEVLGYSKSHLNKEINRPIILLRSK